MSNEWADYEMPWGKHQGECVGQVPSSYLRWILNEVDEDKWPKLVEAADRELSWRDEHNQHFED
uniref:Putative quorum-sensing-regulated virulence factor n=1 Tax=viral metagenome TaxID=1070528 RepID=A0A6M3LCY2_9ZZZZ